MTQKTVKVGDRFRLGAWVWVVKNVRDAVYLPTFKAVSQGSVLREIELSTQDIDCLDWLEPEVKKLTKEQANDIKDYIILGAKQVEEGSPYDMILKKIDSMTEL